MGLYDLTLGPLLAGIFFNTFLYGLVTYQFAAYYRTKFNDQTATKHTVLFLFILDSFHSVSAIYMAWHYAVTNFGNAAALSVVIWPNPFTAIATALAAVVTQIYLGYRIWCLTNSKFLYGMVIVLVIPSFILGISCGVAAWAIHIHSELPRMISLVTVWLCMQVVVDMFITITLVVVFVRSRTGFRKTDTILNRLIRGAVQTGLLAGIFSLGGLIAFVVVPDTNIYELFSIPIGRVYTNTFLDTLLTRELLKAEMDGTDHVSGAPNSLYWAPANPSRSTSTGKTTSIQLKAVQESSCADIKAVPLDA